MLTDLMNRLRLGAAGGLAVATLAVALAGASAAQAQALVTWDDYTDVGQNAVIEQLNKNFQAAHPGVTINRTARTFDDLSMTLKLTVAAGNGPAVTKVNQGAADQGTMVKQKLLLPIDDYVKQYGWDKRFGERRAGPHAMVRQRPVRRGPLLRRVRPRRNGRALLQPKVLARRGHRGSAQDLRGTASPMPMRSRPRVCRRSPSAPPSSTSRSTC